MSLGRELSTHERVRTVQNQIRIAVINHQILFERSQAFPHDAEVLNHMRIMKQMLLSMGRKQLELMQQFKKEVHDNGGNPDEKVLSWPDRDQCAIINKAKAVVKRPEMDIDKRVQIVRRKQLAPNFSRTGVKMQSLLKVNHSATAAPLRKESERLKAAAAAAASASKSAETSSSSAPKAKSLQLAKGKEENKPSSQESRLWPSASDHTPIKTSEMEAQVKSELTPGLATGGNEATSLDDLSQENFLVLFGLVHKEKRKTMVVGPSKRKRRTAAGRSTFYNDYLQPKRPYSRQAQVLTATAELSSSQELGDVDDERSVDKPSASSSPNKADHSASSETLIIDEDTSEPDDRPRPVEEEIATNEPMSDVQGSLNDSTTIVRAGSTEDDTAIVKEDRLTGELRSSINRNCQLLAVAASAKAELLPCKKVCEPTSQTGPSAERSLEDESCSNAELNKCTSCGRLGDSSLSTVCPLCATAPHSSISSIVGASAPSSPTSTDCSEVIKRYLDETKEKELTELSLI